jgi:chaperone modulatory protein CbpM
MAATAMKRATFALVAGRRTGPPLRADIEVLAHDAGLHPELVRRLVRLGAVDPAERDAAAHLAAVVRLRRDLGLNYAGAILAYELLERIERLEGSRWTRTS